MNTLGIIALDIDGTITTHHNKIDKKVQEILKKTKDKGWQLIFLTGRTFSFAKPIFSHLPFSFFCVLQNGALILKFPEIEILEKNYLSVNVLPSIQNILCQERIGFTVETGIENDDKAYYLKSAFPKEDLEYLNFRKEISPEEWISVDTFEEFPYSFFPVIKYFAKKDTVDAIARHLLEHIPDLSITPIKDPFREEGYLAHVNHRRATKGQALDLFLQNHPKKLLIVAGDDYNDLEMLQKADFKIVMETAPEEVKQVADIIAPMAKKQGIVKALEEVDRRYGRGHIH